MSRTVRLALLTVVCLACLIGVAQPQATTRPSSQPATTTSAPSGNTVAGMAVAKGEDWVSVRGAGEERGTRYLAAEKETAAAIAKLTVPCQVKIVWRAEGEKRLIVSLRAAAIATSGVVTGVVTGKGENWIEVKPADGEAEHYLTIGDATEVKAAIAEAKAGDRVKVTWQYVERKRVMKLEKAPTEQ